MTTVELLERVIRLESTVHILDKNLERHISEFNKSSIDKDFIKRNVTKTYDEIKEKISTLCETINELKAELGKVQVTVDDNKGDISDIRVSLYSGENNITMRISELRAEIANAVADARVENITRIGEVNAVALSNKMLLGMVLSGGGIAASVLAIILKILGVY